MNCRICSEIRNETCEICDNGYLKIGNMQAFVWSPSRLRGVYLRFLVTLFSNKSKERIKVKITFKNLRCL